MMIYSHSFNVMLLVVCRWRHTLHGWMYFFFKQHGCACSFKRMPSVINVVDCCRLFIYFINIFVNK